MNDYLPTFDYDWSSSPNELYKLGSVFPPKIAFGAGVGR
jgi:hypothetical protein